MISQEQIMTPKSNPFPFLSVIEPVLLIFGLKYLYQPTNTNSYEQDTCNIEPYWLECVLVSCM